MELEKTGYKQTEIGVIPQDWEVKTLESLCIRDGLVRGPFGGTLKKEYFTKKGFKVYEQRNAIYRTVDKGEYFIDINKYKDLERFQVYPDDFIVSCSGTIGSIYRIPKKAPMGVINQALLKIRIDEEKIDSDFFLSVFRSVHFQERIKENTHGGAMPNLVGMDVFRNTLLQVPPLPEQRAIAQALSDADALIEALEQQIAKQRAVKQGAMQELLTGKRRLPGFSGEWEVKRLGDIADIDPEQLDSDTKPNYEFNYISLENIDFGVLRDSTIQVFYNAPSRARRRLRYNDILVSTVRPNLKSHFWFRETTENWVCSTGFSVLRCRKGMSYPGYIFAHFFAEYISRQIEGLLTGSNYPAINSSDIKQLEIPICSLEEQTAIATVLSDMDAQIAVLEEKLAKVKQVKQGMMQELLTGRIRLT